MAWRALVGICGLLVACGGTSGGPDGGDAGDAGGDGSVGIEPSCALAMETATSPIVTAARGPCDFGFSLSVAAGANDVAYVGFTTNIGNFHPRLWTIDPKSTPTVEKDPIAPEIFRVIADPSGTPALIGAGDRGRVGPLMYFPGKPGAWSGETVTPDFAHWFDVAYAPDGTLHALWASDGSTAVGHRTGPGTWSTTQLDNAFEGDVAITVGQDNQPRYVFFKRRADMSARDVFYAAGSAAPLAFSKQPFGTYGNEHTQIALATGDVPIVVLDAADGTHLLAPSAMPVVDVVVPEMKPVAPPSCQLGNNTSCSGTCNESADGSTGHVLAAAADGTVWLASIHRHVDRDFALQQRCQGICQCMATLTNDRSTAELTLAKASATGTVDVRWRLPLANADGIVLAMAIRSTRAHVALVTPGGSTLDADVRYLAIDLSKL